MLKRSLLAVMGLVMALAFVNPPKAHAGVVIGVTVGARPVYRYPYVIARPVSRPVYVYPRPYYYPRPIFYRPVYERPYWRHERWERHEYREHHHRDWDRDRDRW
jgi:hypothetical protein